MTVPSLSVPETAAGISPEWLTTALTAGGHLHGVRVVEVSSTPIGTGQVAACERLTVRYDGPTDVPATMVVKLADTDPEMRKKIKAHGIREVRFYQQLAVGLSIAVPTCYYADIDVEGGTFVLLLEDISVAQQGDQLAGCSVQVATVAVNSLVGLHAPRWGDPALVELPWLHDTKAAERKLKLQAVPLLWAGFRERYGALLNDDILRAGTALVDNLEGYLFAESGPWTLVHCDYRLDNMLIRTPASGEPELRVVDWQTCGDGPALEDVAYFLGAGLPTDVRREFEEPLVRGYYDRLTNAGVSGYDWDECWRDYRRGTWSGLLMAIYASMLVNRTERGDQMFLTMADRHAKHALDQHADEVIAR